MNTDYAAKLALFLLERTGSIFGTWEGRMTADKQRKLFGFNIGKGTIVINGKNETLCNRVNAGFGRMIDRGITLWSEL